MFVTRKTRTFCTCTNLNNLRSFHLWFKRQFGWQSMFFLFFYSYIETRFLRNSKIYFHCVFVTNFSLFKSIVVVKPVCYCYQATFFLIGLYSNTRCQHVGHLVILVKSFVFIVDAYIPFYQFAILLTFHCKYFVTDELAKVEMR